MKVKILELDSGELIAGEIRKGVKTEMPSLTDGWSFKFNKHSLPKGKRAFILVKENSPDVIEGCMIFSIHSDFGPFMDYLEVAPHNLGRRGKYKRVAGCLIAYACGLSFQEGVGIDRGILTFKAFGKDEASRKQLEELYRGKYRAIMNPLKHMEIHQAESKFLIEEYLNNQEE